MKLAWMTDVHLDHLGLWEKGNFFRSLHEVECDAFLITGDISNGRSLISDLTDMSMHAERPIYFVLGNHDYWHERVDRLRAEVKNLALAGSFEAELVHLNNVKEYITVVPGEVALVGHDCWYDAMYGDWKTSRFQMVDWMLTEDYSDLVHISHRVPRGLELEEKQHIVGKSRALAAQGVEHIRKGIAVAIQSGYKEIVVASHVPPFDEAHIFMGKKGDASAQPWFTSKLLGDMLLEYAENHAGVKFTSLSGHTHGAYQSDVRSNLTVHVGGARYEHPELQCVFEFGRNDNGQAAGP